MRNQFVNLLQEENIRLNISAKDWREALKSGIQIIIDLGGVEKRYLDSIFKLAEELGPYMVIAPGLALGHAGPDAGVNFTCFSLVTLKEPVNFGVPDCDPVEIIICFAAPSKKAHMGALREMAMFCSEMKNIDALKKANRPKEVRDLLIDFFNPLKNS